MLAIGLIIVLWSVAVARFRQRYRAREPWGPVDYLVSLVWLGLSVAVLFRYWPEGPDALGLGMHFGPVVVTVFIAYQMRRDLFDVEQGRESRSRGSHAVSLHYARLLRVVERETGTLPLDLCAGELVEELDLEDAEIAGDLVEFVALYERVRYAGGQWTPQMERSWRKRMRRLQRAVVKELRRQLR